MDADPPIADEAAAIARVLARTGAGNGDDAAILRVGGGAMCVSTDSTVEGVHAPAGTAPGALGRHAVGRALSDLAAMGAAPAALVCAVHVPPGRWQDAVSAVEAVGERASEQGTELVGGDFTRVDSPALALVVTVLGRRAGARREPFVPRSGMRPGDELHVTGTLGASAVALMRGEALPEPPDRLRAGTALARAASAMIDLSDGLACDARNLARSSGCGVELELDAVPLAPGCSDPVRAATAGDDYELLVAIAPGRTADARRLLAGACPGLQLTRVGRATDAHDHVRASHDGVPVELESGFVHR